MSSSCLNAIYSILLAILFFFVESEHYNCIFIIVKMYLVYYFEKIYRKRKVWALTLTNCWLWVWSKHVLERNWCFFPLGMWLGLQITFWILFQTVSVLYMILNTTKPRNEPGTSSNSGGHQAVHQDECLQWSQFRQKTSKCCNELLAGLPNFTGVGGEGKGEREE